MLVEPWQAALTGLADRAEFYAVLDGLLAGSRQNGVTFAVVLLERGAPDGRAAAVIGAA